MLETEGRKVWLDLEDSVLQSNLKTVDDTRKNDHYEANQLVILFEPLLAELKRGKEDPKGPNHDSHEGADLFVIVTLADADKAQMTEHGSEGQSDRIRHHGPAGDHLSEAENEQHLLGEIACSRVEELRVAHLPDHISRDHKVGVGVIDDGKDELT